MNTPNTIYDETRDMDTLGGRIGRAREMADMTHEEAAQQLGVTLATWENWESDREEPRANRLTMLAGFLNVSTTWLLHGIGEAPSSDEYSEIAQELNSRLAEVEKLHVKTGEAIEQLKTTIARLNKSEEGL
ncbi:MAG: helix-turn-helix transcriptional regulator [Rhizobiaceae bacterium]|nr:helix-turn-helix transcriptional regulator [Rhizobiaceae bacterium]